jgi:hypothetical protein
MDENLIGYLLNALDESDRRQVEAHLRQHPESQARLEILRRALPPLAVDAEAPAPPAGLVLRTLARVAEVRARPLPKAPPPKRTAAAWRGPRRADLLAAAVLLIFLGALTGPLLVKYWHLHGRQVCADNLRQYGEMLHVYSENNDGKLPRVADDGPCTFAAGFVPLLREGNNLKKYPQPLACDGYGRRPGSVPSVSEVEQARDQEDLDLFCQRARQLAGNYAYSLGYRDNGSLIGLSARDCNQPIMADHRPLPGVGTNSPNHGGLGQNVLYVGGNVKWHTTPSAGCPDDDIYLNRKGRIAAGLDCDDSVLGSGETTPGSE